MERRNFTELDKFVYYLFCIISLGGAYVNKVIAKKALSEMLANEAGSVPPGIVVTPEASPDHSDSDRQQF